jgi:haloalkane dehalogenase
VRFAPANTQPFNAGPFADDGALAHAQYDPRVSAIQRAAGLAYRSAGDSTDRVALLVHGVPESSYMWRDVLPALAGAGWRAIAPDLHGFGDSPPDPPGTWERHVEALERFVQELGLGPVALVTHDWGVMIGLRWACDHPGSVRALAISDGGFFADREWHDMAKAMRTPEVGEQLVGSVTRESLGAMLNGLSIGITDDALDEYWKAYADETARLGILELYRSGDFDKLEPYEGRVAEMDVPALVVWGAQDPFAGVEFAHRFHAELPGSELVIFDGAGHFVWEDERDRATAALVRFLAECE